MIYTVKPGDTFESVANAVTIGGAAYAPAIQNISDSGFYPGAQIVIPDGWVKPGYSGSTSGFGNSISQNIPLLVVIGGLMLALFSIAGK